ncbi:lipopolysaccharide transport periplasmic protein LptA [Delftia tsuruhatensis]|uniref:Lipopolysaccharide export system protein LptA n=1 Tax=Delftia tsuruhatensis TaxID=180282 RepID=A0AAX3SM27_9BURK|nr:lipopolysaccharide transport periplasmic protein LptA [Delftia tsuruhatensis]WFF81014.1 lipopolysaccharide transport periplasmic protein LptA [Delftia tsuruhatensis]
MKQRLSPLLLAAALAAFAGLAQAEKADSTKPMNIEADALRHDELKQTSVFTGNVVMTKGTIVLRGAQLDVRQDPEGFQYGLVTAEAGKRAFFRQKRDTVPGQPEEFVEGEGEVIEYDGKADLVKFIRRGELRRYRGGQLSDEITGSIIVYNNLTDVFTVDGQKTSGGQPSSTAGQGGRVRAVLAPKEGTPGSQPRAPAAGAPGTSLQPSNTLDSLGGTKR